MMNKRLVFILGGFIFLLFLIYVGISVYDDHLHKLEDLRIPSNMGSYYSDFGYLKIDPEAILASLESGNPKVFTPLAEEDALDLEAIPDLSIYWTQVDFMKIASAIAVNLCGMIL